MSNIYVAVALVFAMGSTATAQNENASAEFDGSKGFVGDKGYVADTVAPQTRQVAVKEHVPGRTFGTFSTTPKHLRVWTVPGCPAGFNGMFRGGLYCRDGKPMY
ncbi:MAG: hypothetical protein ABJL67_03520 [Sulfitobacter sp.]